MPDRTLQPSLPDDPVRGGTTIRMTIYPEGEPLLCAGPPAAPPGYVVERELGRGGMGVVYLARQAALSRQVALKMVLAGKYAAAADVVRFEREAGAVARLNHPNVVQIYEVGQHDDRPYFTMEYVPGGPLNQYAADPLAPREAAALMEQVARGVAFAHANGIIHRDLKPENILLQRSEARGQKPDGTAGTPRPSDLGLVTSDYCPKVTDFGLAKTLGSDDALTVTGAIMGTPGYMAPEQAGGESKRVGPAADVWALGAVLYRLLTGRPPFAAPTPYETLLQVIGTDPPAPSSLVPKLPRDLETICLKCLRKDRTTGTRRRTPWPTTCGGFWPGSRSWSGRSGRRSGRGSG